MSLKLPVCEFCKNFGGYDKQKGIWCKAYPDGIPRDKDIFVKSNKECANGFKFEDVNPDYNSEKSSGGLMEKFGENMI